MSGRRRNGHGNAPAKRIEPGMQQRLRNRQRDARSFIDETMPRRASFADLRLLHHESPLTASLFDSIHGRSEDQFQLCACSRAGFLSKDFAQERADPLIDAEREATLQRFTDVLTIGEAPEQLEALVIETGDPGSLRLFG